MTKFITVEGIEGSGKSTLITGLKARLDAHGFPCLCTREPGATLVGKKIRELLLDLAADCPEPKSELLLFLADRREHVTKVILPALDRGLIVLCDRFSDSTEAYQGYGRCLDLKTIRTLNKFATDGLEPGLTILLDLDPASGLTRAGTRTPESWSRFEEQDFEFHSKVRQGFLALASEYSQRFRVIDATASPQQILDTAWNHINEALGSYAKL